MAERAGSLVVVAAGGTGGHLFPAEALAIALAPPMSCRAPPSRGAIR
jgi:hypothetical protein